MDYERLDELLSKVRLFNRLPKVKVAAVRRRIQALQFPPNKVILEEGKPIKFMFIVGAGSVEVRRKDANTGISFLLRTLQAGDSFGEMALLSGQPYTVSLMTTEQTVLFILNPDNFRTLLIEEPEISLTLNQLLAEQLISAYDQVGIQTMDLGDFQIDPEVANLIPRQLVLMHKVVPIARRGTALTVGMVNPGNLIAHDDIKKSLRDVLIEPVLISDEDYVRFVDKVYPGALAAQKARQEKPSSGTTQMLPTASKDAGKESPKENNNLAQTTGFMDDEVEEMIQAIAPPSDEEEKPNLADLEAQSKGAGIVKLANDILIHALKMGTSDIHLEPQQQGLVVRYRIDGNLRVIKVLPTQLQSPLISRFKILSNLDITERRVPQDGRISSAYQGRRIDFRVSTVPAKYGEKMVMRILDNSGGTLQLSKLIAHQKTLDQFMGLINKPHGIIFVTGPTGSGKTTTLYSALSEINTPDTNISTAEDPIEYDLAGINQVQVQRAVGVDFAKILRAFLRQDPDVILVGETRDAETAKTAVEAALTGHLVFTTLHTNSAAASFARLEEMGVEPFMVACATMGIVAQRLARRLCPECKAPDTPDQAMLDYLGFGQDEVSTIMKAVGCKKCGGSGFKGRVGVYEVLVMDDNVRPLVSKRKSAEEIESAAIDGGMMTLAMYGRWLIRNGLTTLEEILRVISFD